MIHFILAWHQDFPTDVTGNLDKLKEFVWSDFEMCKWIGLSVVSIQVTFSPFIEFQFELKKKKKKGVFFFLFLI